MKKLAVIMLAFIILVLIGCADSESDKARKTVAEYNQTLIKVLTTGKLDLLKKVALDQEVSRIQLFLISLNEEHKVMSADLKDLEFTDTRRITAKTSNGKNTSVFYRVYTKELWEYKYLDAQSFTVREGPSKIRYNATYDVVRPSDKLNWVVYKVYFQEDGL